MERLAMYYDRGTGAWHIESQEELSRIYAEPGNISVGDIMPLGSQGELLEDHARVILRASRPGSSGNFLHGISEVEVKHLRRKMEERLRKDKDFLYLTLRLADEL